MNVADFRRLALSLENSEESSHMGAPDFRIGGKIFATLAHQSKGYGNLMLSPEQQAALVTERPDAFLPVPGGWGRGGSTHVILAAVDAQTLLGVLQMAYRLRRTKSIIRRPPPGTRAKKSADR